MTAREVGLMEHITNLEAKVRFFSNLLANVICKKCGGVSWDVPITDYCQCNPGREKPHAGT